MEKELIISTLRKLKENSPKRNFKQSIDLIINLKGLDLKKADHQVNMFVALPHGTGKKVSVCALVDADMEGKAKGICDEVVALSQFERYKNKAEVKRLATRHDFFIAQASIMPKVAAAFGRFFGPRGKMPNPKLGSVLAPNTNISQLCDRLRNTAALVTKNEPTIKCKIGGEDTNEEHIIDNVMAVYNNVVHKLPNDQQNVKSVMLKLTMGPAFIIGKEAEDDNENKKAKGKGRGKIKLNEKQAEAKPAEAKEKPKEALKEEDEKKVPSHVNEAEPKKKAASKNSPKESKKQSK